MVSDFLFALVRPRFWVMNYPFSEEWDRAVNKVIDMDMVSSVGRYTASAGKSHIWVANYPYAYGVPYAGESIGARPSRRTILRLREYLNAKVAKEWMEAAE